MSLLQLRKIFREIATKIWLVLTEFSDSAEENLFLFLDFSVFKTIFHFRVPAAVLPAKNTLSKNGFNFDSGCSKDQSRHKRG